VTRTQASGSPKLHRGRPCRSTLPPITVSCTRTYSHKQGRQCHAAHHTRAIQRANLQTLYTTPDYRASVCNPGPPQTQWPLSHTRALQDTCCCGDPKACCATTDRLQEPASLAWSVHTFGDHNQAQHASPHAHLPNTTPNQVVGPTRQRTVNHQANLHVSRHAR
jgi:hypothetical protein